jgi:CHASE2 domain-containing sensor protein
MNWWITFLLTVSFTVIFILIQRSEQSRRCLVWTSMIAVLGLIAYWAFTAQVVGEAGLGLVFGLMLAGLFWLLIGRYNPVGSSDNIKVLGLDD